MTADEFATELRKCIPSAEQMDREGLLPVIREEIISSYTLPSRQEGCSHENPLLDLVLCYDASKLEIGMVRFVGPYVQAGHLWRVGTVEVDPLYLDLHTGAVCSIERGTSHVVWECAASGSRFLDAMLHVARLPENGNLLDNPFEDPAIKCADVERCAGLAGGEKYLPFYEMLFGVE